MGLFAHYALRCYQPVFWKCALNRKCYLISPEDMIFPKCLSGSLSLSWEEESWRVGPAGRNVTQASLRHHSWMESPQFSSSCLQGDKVTAQKTTLCVCGPGKCREVSGEAEIRWVKTWTEWGGWRGSRVVFQFWSHKQEAGPECLFYVNLWESSIAWSRHPALQAKHWKSIGLSDLFVFTLLNSFFSSQCCDSFLSFHSSFHSSCF